MAEQVEGLILQFRGRDLQRHRCRNSAPSVHLLKTNLMSKAPASAASSFVELRLREALGRQRLMIDRRRAASACRGRRRRRRSRRSRRSAIAERAQRFGDGAVDDLEIAAAGELLEFDQREIGLDAGGVAIHDEADRAGRRDRRVTCALR